MKPYIIVEGKTEEKFINEMLRGERNDQVTVVRANGKGNLLNILEPRLDKKTPVLILRDCDRGETIERVSRKMSKEIQLRIRERIGLSSASFFPVENWSNIFSLRTKEGLEFQRILLHVATPVPFLERIFGDYPFENTTTDDYILAAALTDEVLKKFAEKFPKEKEFEGILRKKVVQEIPDLLRANGIQGLVGKDMLAIYMTVARFNSLESPDAFAQKVVANVKLARDEYLEIFASHIAAIEMLRQ